jgi:hypothetical protein
VVEAFASLYRRHIEREEAELLPRAAATLAAHELATIGGAMARRRGVRR